ncbi:uncharacterized protein EAF01_004836 [Botrytis porri]|uniref:Uncharacterized protein n=1 Tax=Botrytis porri TaxID=87229 RepID=A0A4Z1KYP2_9HELO|nr:uncharacterized protein EAF01_004836 [Botrytis porri]KAF7907249.1 hypothetical protein EAF01_004836 [Botrytis porri]TGO89560.1 hypothetical protein BPOR_0103g00060 [Botrytis porri]
MITSKPYSTALIEAAAPISALIAPLETTETVVDSRLRRQSEKHIFERTEIGCVRCCSCLVNIGFAVRNENEVGCIMETTVHETLDVDPRLR